MSDAQQGSAWSQRLPDIIAGLSIAGLLLPEAVAYSSIGNLPPQAGVIALFAGLLIYSLLGKSRFAIVSATSSSAAVLAAATASLANGDVAFRSLLAVGLIALTGVFFIVASVAKFGSMSDFIAKPVLRGFSFGLAIVIILKQLPAVVDVHPVHSSVIPMAVELISKVGQWNWWGFFTGAGALLILVVFAEFRRVPGALVVIVVGVLAGKFLGLQQHGVGLVGDINLQLSRPTIPNLPRADWLRLGELGFAMVLVLYAESYSSIRSFALKHGDTIDPNRDLLALGVANVVSGFFQGMPVGAGYSATSANEAAGAQSHLAAWVAVGVMLLIVLTLLPAIALTPEPVLAAIVIHAVGHTLNPSVFKPYIQWRRDRLVVVLAVVAVLLLGVLDGLLAGIAVSLAMMLKRLSESRMAVLGQLGEGHDYVNVKYHADAHTIPGILILRPDVPLFFANVDRMLGLLRHELAKADHIKVVVLSMEESPDLDGTSVEAVRDLAADVARQGKTLLLARLKEPVEHVLTRANIPTLDPTCMKDFSVDDAVVHARSLVQAAPA